ncbi:hypothetical protein BOO69_17145 [Sulfitobacter alexandrii]|uniref:Phytase-like domain-containing protein n=2 Tax=Sulfitobacter alexandrii TaxID=1917485 RepID=A0A1J0WN33_9RHOB|nr:hypothetical protein BOO69_17145 [Sulfitobacter alexandrii]
MRPRRLIPLTIAMVLASALLARADTLTLVSETVWREPGKWFGGFSGLETSADGQTADLVTDRATLVRIRLTREAGRIVAITTLRHTPITYLDGTPAKGDAADVEGLAITDDGAAYVSFEHDHRVGRLNLDTGAAGRLPDHPDFAGFPDNGGLEALAVHTDGRVFAVPESRGGRNGGYPVYVFDGREWNIGTVIPGRGPFRPVGADFGPDGLLYLLERAVTPLGFRSRIRRFDPAAENLAEVTLLTSAPGRFDNLESISLWQDADGKTRITAISDDNFFPIQRTQIVEFMLTE